MRMLQLVLATLVAGGVSSTAQAQSASAAPGACDLPHAVGVVQQQQLLSGQRQRAYRLFVPCKLRQSHAAAPRSRLAR